MPDEGYEVDKINVSHGEVEKIEENSYKFIMPSKKVSMTVVFKKVDDSINKGETDEINGNDEIDEIDEVKLQETTFIDTNGNEYNIVSIGDINIYEKDVDLKYIIDLDKFIPVNEYPVTIETNEEYVRGSIVLEENYVPELLYNINYEEDIKELVPFYYNSETSELTYNLIGKNSYNLLAVKSIEENNNNVSELKSLTRSIDNTVKMFNITENENGNLKVSLDYFINNKENEAFKGKLDFEKVYYQVKMIEPEQKDIVSGKTNLISNSDYKISLTDLKSGVYEISILQNDLGKDTRIWKQDVFVQATPTLPNTEIEQLAKKYAPIVVFHEDEEYFPISFKELFDAENIDDVTVDNTGEKGPTPEINLKTIFGGSDIAYNDLGIFMAYNGHKEYLINGDNDLGLQNIKGDIEKSTVYYSYMEDEDKFYINYHFIYAFDPKAPEMSSGKHNFDRESMTIEFNKSNKTPLNVIYSGHLKDQTLGLIDTVLEWKNGAVKIKYEDIISYDNHPIISIAQGAHAIYPVGGNYYLVVEKKRKEPAGIFSFDDKLNAITPDNLNSKFDKYNLRMLELDEISQNKNVNDGVDGKNPYLVFSGYWVDVLDVYTMGANNTQFPPFTGKEKNVANYVDGAYTSWIWGNVPNKNLYITSSYITKNITDYSLDASTIELEIKYFNEDINKISVGTLNEFDYNFIEIERLVNAIGGLANYNSEGNIQVSTVLGGQFTISEGDELNFYKYVKGIENSKVIRMSNGKLYAPIREIVYLYNEAIKSNDYTLEVLWNQETKKISVVLK